MRPSTDQPPTDPTNGRDEHRRVTVPEASVILGITSDAVRARLRRGTLHKEQGEDGTVYVRLNGADRPDRPDGRTTSRPTDPPPSGEAREEQRAPLVETLQDQVEYLRGQLDAEREAGRRKDHIIMSLTQRIPAIEPPETTPPESPPETPGGPKTASESGDRGHIPSEDSQPSEGGSEGRSSWWRRFFGF